MKEVKESVEIGNALMLPKPSPLMMLVRHCIPLVLLKELVVLNLVLVLVTPIQLSVKLPKLLTRETLVFGIKPHAEPKSVQMLPRPLKLIRNVMDT